MKQSLLDFLQSASNAVAGNVAGPVDLIGMGLNKIGVPVGAAPVGGTEWMKRQGLMRDVQQGPARVLGETAGLLGPALATQFAPQIARGLLQVEANAMKPRTLNKEAGAIVWHGSPHKFDKFDSSKIGTGEGAQAYGHGLYLAESPDVARSYVSAGGAKSTATPEAYAADIVGQLGGEKKALKHLQDILPPAGETTFSGDSRELIANAIKAVETGAYKQKAGAIYKVDLPDEQIAKMLDWDKPLSQQPKAVQTAYKKYLKSPQASEHAKSWTRYSDGMRLDQAEPLLKNPGGENLYKNAFPSREAANQWALENGIPGIRYLDGGSRGAGNGTSNFVVFPGNEGLLSILERNGVPLK